MCSSISHSFCAFGWGCVILTDWIWAEVIWHSGLEARESKRYVKYLWLEMKGWDHRVLSGSSLVLWVSTWRDLHRIAMQPAWDCDINEKDTFIVLSHWYLGAYLLLKHSLYTYSCMLMIRSLKILNDVNTVSIMGSLKVEILCSHIFFSVSRPVLGM